MKKRPSFQQQVFLRRRERRERVMMYLAWVFMIAFGTWFGYWEYKRAKAVDAPTWADFKVAKGDLTEYVAQRRVDDGVPYTLSINGESWSLVQVNNFNDVELATGKAQFNATQAQTNCNARTITYIRTDNAMVLHTNLIHEIFHAGACLHGGDAFWNSEKPDQTNHPGVYHLGEFMATFLHDNPDFTVWMANWEAK